MGKPLTEDQLLDIKGTFHKDICYLQQIEQFSHYCNVHVKNVLPRLSGCVPASMMFLIPSFD